jgi:hypothetical protein
MLRGRKRKMEMGKRDTDGDVENVLREWMMLFLVWERREGVRSLVAGCRRRRRGGVVWCGGGDNVISAQAQPEKWQAWWFVSSPPI